MPLNAFGSQSAAVRASSSRSTTTSPSSRRAGTRSGSTCWDAEQVAPTPGGGQGERSGPFALQGGRAEAMLDLPDVSSTLDRYHASVGGILIIY